MDEPSIDELIAIYRVQVPVTVGRATIAWNNVCHAVFQMFQLLSELDDETAKATFLVVNSDRSQRDMVAALIDTKLKHHSTGLAKRAHRQLADINRLAGKRNDILHVIYLDDLNPQKVSQFHDRGHLRGKQGADLLDSIHKTTLECLDISMDILGTCSKVMQLPSYQNRSLLRALLQSNPRPTSAKLATEGEFGLLDAPATTPRSFESDQY